MPEDSRPKRAWTALPLYRSVSRSRKEETLLYRLRVNRETSHMETKGRFGRASRPACPHCGLDPKQQNTTALAAVDG